MRPGLQNGGRGVFGGQPTFTLRNRLGRALFQVVWLLLARWTPPPMRRWRIAILRAFGAKADWSAQVYGSARIWHPALLELGAEAVVGPGVVIYCMDRITLGRRAVVSQGAHLCTGTHDIDSVDFELVTRPITIGDHAWICAEAFVGPGVAVGEGAVLGARGISFSPLAPWTVYSGNPAVPRRRRYQDVNGARAWAREP